MLRIRFAATAACITLAAFLAACGSDTTASPPPSNGGGNPPPPPVVAVSSIDLSPGAGEVMLGASAKFTATPRDASGNVLTGRTITWTSSDASIATVDESGMVVGKTPGAVTITAASEGKSAAAAITVKGNVIPVALVTVAAAPDTVEAWDPSPMQATLRDAAANVLVNRVIRWTVSNAALATIDSVTGVLTGVDRGTVTVTATSEGKVGSTTRVIVIKYHSVSAGSMHACDIASGG
ncbi:MAG TPA: Ig-like domain-containing protein, partial [Gemmatimonadaceae bacterium]|nr:Ig-like domain-containing protein [Gemmatimonadaceae bacterium]